MIEADNFIIEDYFKRINFEGNSQTTIENITQIAQHHIFSIPFENLDVQAGKIVSMIPEEIVDKIVYKNRGGYCYETNGLLALALQKLGVPCYFTAARPMFYPEKRPRTHLVIIAEIEGEKYLLDVGFGSHGIRKPINLNKIDEEINQDGFLYRLQKMGKEYLLQAKVKGEWLNQYAFSEQEYEFIDFVPANFMNSKHPDAIFVKAPLIVLYNPEGKKVLFKNTITYYTSDTVTEKTFTDAEYPLILEKEFGLIEI